MTPQQCKAGRALLSWSQEDLAKAAQIHRTTVHRFENFSDSQIRHGVFSAILNAFAQEGVRFVRNGLFKGKAPDEIA